MIREIIILILVLVVFGLAVMSLDTRINDLHNDVFALQSEMRDAVCMKFGVEEN